MTDPRAHRVLASVTRVAVLEVLRASGRPFGVLELADRMGLHANTVRRHLELLVEYGHVRALREESGRRGRPRRVYTAVDWPDPEQRNYHLLASVLAAYLRAAEEPEAAAVAAGERFGAEFVQPRRLGETAATPERVVRMLDDIGFQPELTPDRTAIRLHHCPFHELARDQPDIVCGIHLGLIRGALQQLGAPAEATRLVPFVTPRLCVVEFGPPFDP